MAGWVGDDGLFDVILEVLVYLTVGVAVVGEVAGAYYVVRVVQS